MNTLYVVIPCYNEESVLEETGKRLKSKIYKLMDKGIISNCSKVLFVNDGSIDKTWHLINEMCAEDNIFAGINLARNKGHQHALLAGLLSAKDYADMVISIDADLQHDIEAIDEFIDKYNSGADIVYGIRNNRNAESEFKKIFSQGFYKLMLLMGVEIVYNSADYRLMSKRAIEALEEYEEVNVFLRGIIPTIGFKTEKVYYNQLERYAGESKYSIKKMFSFALEGITSFSIKPIRMITVIGALTFIISMGMLIYSLITYFLGNAIQGWSSIVVSIWAIGGIQLLSIGIIGEYIGRVYLETKKRPRYIIQEFIHNEKRDVLGEKND